MNNKTQNIELGKLGKGVGTWDEKTDWWKLVNVTDGVTVRFDIAVSRVTTIRRDTTGTLRRFGRIRGWVETAAYGLREIELTHLVASQHGTEAP